MNWKVAAGAAVAILVALFVVDGVFIVRPDQYAIVTEFGDPVRVIMQQECDEPLEHRGKLPDELATGECTRFAKVPHPGLYFKMPLTQDVRYLDARVRGWDDEATDTKTLELRTIDFTAFARWRIIDPLRFYKSARTEKRAMGGMDSIITARIQSVIREHKLASIVRDRGREFEARAELDLRELIAPYEECLPERNAAVKAVLREQEIANKGREQRGEDAEALRSEIVQSIRESSNGQLEKEFGITILDLHFKKLNYSPKIFAKMVDAISADRERDIQAYRKVGKVCEGSIDQVKIRRRGEIQGAKERQVREILGRAHAEAIRIKREAFGRDPEFFRFIKTLEVYERSLGDDTSLVLSTDSPLLEMFRDDEVMKVAPVPDNLPDAVPAPAPPPAAIEPQDEAVPPPGAEPTPTPAPGPQGGDGP